jgi:CRP/FNR family transcriptional regulator
VAYRWLPERLAAELIRQSRYAGSNQIRLSHQSLADILGTYRETISAILRDFREAGWVKLGYRRITILDPEALEKMTGVIRE